ncbi:MAG: antibiotic biosynthesis monooxygenase [Burkholderiales bacterium]|nr:antibiotic biosynthesis monooxygenase [Burkholderiales bacterium]
MIACIIEFSVREGRDARLREVLAPLLAEVSGVPGFVSKETFDSRARPGRILTVSYWETRDALQQWMASASHRHAIVEGKRDILADYAIRIAEVERAYHWPVNGAADRG